MEARRDPPGRGPIVTGFSGRGFRIGEALYPDGLLLNPERALSWVAPLSAMSIDEGMIAPILDGLDRVPEFLLLGTGVSLERPCPAFVRALDARGIGLEVMDSRAAARAWGVLRQEERWVAAALMPS